jgi:hypothetical protein
MASVLKLISILVLKCSNSTLLQCSSADVLQLFNARAFELRLVRLVLKCSASPVLLY